MTVHSLIVILVAAAGLSADDSFYLGTWRIESAKVAPWWTGSQPPDPAEMKSLVGKSFTFKADMITGPRQMACKGPKYTVKNDPADMLFQGSFGEMHEKDHSVDPVKVAAKVGFKGTSWKTLETGCGNEVDYHFIDITTAAIGLNNYIYSLKKEK